MSDEQRGVDNVVDGKVVTLVVPTIRENSFRDFVKRWAAVGLFKHIARFIVVEDNPKKTFDVKGLDFGTKVLGKYECCGGLDVVHVSWEDIDAMPAIYGTDPETGLQTMTGSRIGLGERSWIIPRRSDTVRSYGYWLAATLRFDSPNFGQLSDYVLTMDDDCYPCGEEDGIRYDGVGFLREHIRNLDMRSKWFNTLNTAVPRGVPYYNRGKLDIVINHGLWTNVLDYDAPHQLAAPMKENYSFDNRIVPAGMFFPMCGMNVMWKQEASVLMYHLLMGKRKPAMEVPGTDADGLLKLPVDRFGDIWCGIFAKKVLDILGKNVATGMPYIRHERASNPFTNLKKEANGIEINEKLWELVDSFRIGDPTGLELKDVYWEMANTLDKLTADDKMFGEHTDYFHTLFMAMKVWAELFDKEER